jgi:hypothetical protein
MTAQQLRYSGFGKCLISRGKPMITSLNNKRAAMAKARAAKSALFAKTLPPSDAATRHRARSLVAARLARGAMVRPDSCSACGATVTPEAHHVDYSRPCDVLWLCRPCHCKVHLGTLVLDATSSQIGGGQ